MKRSWKQVAGSTDSSESVDPFLSEIRGYIELGMKREALRLVRRVFMKATITDEEFSTAMDAVLTHVDRLKSWIPRIESAYDRIPGRTKNRARFFMLCFYVGNQMYEPASQFLPRKFFGSVALIELSFSMEVRLALGQLNEAKKLVNLTSRTIFKNLSKIAGFSILSGYISRNYLIQRWLHINCHLTTA